MSSYHPRPGSDADTRLPRRAPRRTIDFAVIASLLLSPFERSFAAQNGPNPSLTGGERISLNLDKAPLSKALESFAVRYRINILAGPEVSGEVTVNLFDVTIEEALLAMLSINGYGFERSGSFYVVKKLGELTKQSTLDPIETRVRWLDHIRGDEAVKLIEPLKSQEGSFVAGASSESGLESDASKAGGNSPAAGELLVLRDRHSVLEAVEKLLIELDRRPRQVLVEAVVLEVKLGDETALGIDFNTLSGINFTDLSALSDFGTVATAPLIDPLQFQDGVGRAVTSGFASNSDVTDGLHIGLVGDDVAAFIEAVERVTDATILASPRVLAVDRQRAEIIIGAKLGYRTATTTETATTEEVEFLDVGTQLRFRPFIASDGFIRFEIHPENSTGVVDSTGLPSETTTEVTTNVLVKDGATIALGGLISDQVETSIKQIPFLGSLPLVGVLFRRSEDRVQRREIIVLLTPHVVDPTQVDSTAITIADDMASTRDLVLREQLPLSRVRLAKPVIERAEALLERGDAEGAARLADVVIYLMPADVRAAALRKRALALLAVKDRETRTLELLEGTSR